MELVKPDALQTGDKIGIVAPSMHIINEEAVANGVATLQELGFRVEMGPTVRSRYRDLPPENDTRYNIVKGGIDSEKKVHTGTNHQQATRG